MERDNIIPVDILRSLLTYLPLKRWKKFNRFKC